jgi:PAS domain-containing protein
MPSSNRRQPPRETKRAPAGRTAARRQPRQAGLVRAGRTGLISDRFFRQFVFSMRNGVLAITRDGTVAAVNAEACRIFQLKRAASAVGRPFGEVLQRHPDVVRVLASAFELSHLPNRAELRLRTVAKSSATPCRASATSAAARPGRRCSSRT